MFVALAFCPTDQHEAIDLLEWIGQLGGCPAHSAMLIMDAGVEWSIAIEALALANKAFRSATLAATSAPISGWPEGPNALWLLAARQAKERNEPFLWLEPDAIPLCKGWLEKIHAAYGSGFMGHVYDSGNPKFPPQVISGIAVYPADAIDLVEPALEQWPGQAWDVAASPTVLRHTQPTTLIQHFWGQPDLAPTFAPVKTTSSPVNTFTFDNIHPDCVLFHRNKDGTLINLLRTKLCIPRLGGIVVVLPFCKYDGELMLKNIEWQNNMGMPPKTHECLLSYDQTAPKEMVKRIQARALLQYSQAYTTSYNLKGGIQFPQTAAFQHAAHTMHRMGRNWLWLEADCWPLKANWLTALQKEYDTCGKPFCGPVVPGRHMNGTAIYPWDTPVRMPRTMSHTNNAWDVEAESEIRGQIHDCSKLWQLAWAVQGGKLDPQGGEECPGFPKGSPIINQIRRDAVLFHRCKDLSLRDRLTERLHR